MEDFAELHLKPETLAPDIAYPVPAEALCALQAGKPSTEAIQAAKSVGAFSGKSLWSNLINQLNHWGFHKWLGLGDSADLFSTSRHLVQTTSLLRYPVFVKDDDYRGPQI